MSQSLNSVLCDAFSKVTERTVLKEENGATVEGENGIYILNHRNGRTSFVEFGTLKPLN